MNQSTKDAIERELKSARDIAEQAERENRDFSGDERAKVDAHLREAKSLRERHENQSELRKQLSDLTDGIGIVDPPAKGDADKPAGYVAPLRSKGVSLGDQFVNSNEFKSMLASVPGGRFGEKARVQSQPFGVKALITGVSETSAGSLVNPQNLGLLDPFYQRPLTIRQLVTNGTTGTDAIDFVRLVSVTNNAAPVPEATSAGVIGSGDPVVTGAAGGLKPESAMLLEKDTTNVKTIAHWLPATKRALSDAGQVKTLIDQFLLYGLEEELEDQIIAGNGVGENFDGIATTSGIQTQAAPTGEENNFDVARMARRKVRIGGRAIPTAYVLNPIDWETLELARDAEQRYYGPGPFAMMTPTLWGLPVVESEAVPAGTGYVADWRQAVLWDREQASIQVTDSHADFFVRNLVAILAELRAAFAVLRPSAFVQITWG